MKNLNTSYTKASCIPLEDPKPVKEGEKTDGEEGMLKVDGGEYSKGGVRNRAVGR